MNPERLMKYWKEFAMKPFVFLLFVSLISSYAQSQNPFGYSYDSIRTEFVDTIFYEFVDGVQIIEVDHLGAYWRGVQLADQAYPRALSAAVDVPKPVSNEYYVRDSLGKIIKAYCAHQSLEELNRQFLAVPITRPTKKLNGQRFFVISNQKGGRDRVSFSGDWTQKGLTYGLIDRKGEKVVPTKYQKIQITARSIRLMKEYKWALMDMDLNFQCDFLYDRILTNPLRDSSVTEITYFKTGRQFCGFRVQGKEKVIETTCYDYMLTNLHWVKIECLLVTKDGKRGLIDFDGNLVLPLEYDEIHFTNYNSCPEKPCVRLTKGREVEFVEPEKLLQKD